MTDMFLIWLIHCKQKFIRWNTSLLLSIEYPDALNDAIQAYYWLIETGHKPENISVCGDSAGAHLAASLVHKLAQIDEEQIPHSQFLIYPMCDPDCKSDSYNFLSEGYMLTKKTMIWFWDKFSNNINNINDQAFNLIKLTQT